MFNGISTITWNLFCDTEKRAEQSRVEVHGEVIAITRDSDYEDSGSYVNYIAPYFLLKPQNMIHATKS